MALAGVGQSEQRSRRVYWLTEAFYPPIVGGQELFVARIVQALSARGVKVSVITRQADTDSPKVERIGAVDVRRIAPAGILKGKGWKAFFPLIAYLIRLLLLLVREVGRYDVLVVSGVKVMPLVVVPLCLFARKQCILRVESYFELQETISAQSLQAMQGSFGRLLARSVDGVRTLAMRRAGHIVAISTEIRNALLQRGVPRERIAQIPNAVDLNTFKPVAAEERLRLRTELKLPRNRTLAIFLGRLSRAKGLLMLVEAWPELLARNPDLYLVIVGSGRLSFDNCEDEAKERVQARRLQEHVQFCAESDRVHQYLQAVDLFVFPTDYEGFSLALVEALGSALPVVVTSVGAAPDLIRHGENGFLFPPKNAQALVATMQEALDARARWSAIGQAARLSVAAFDLAVVADRYTELCSGLQ